MLRFLIAYHFDYYCMTLKQWRAHRKLKSASVKHREAPVAQRRSGHYATKDESVWEGFPGYDLRRGCFDLPERLHADWIDESEAFGNGAIADFNRGRSRACAG